MNKQNWSSNKYFPSNNTPSLAEQVKDILTTSPLTGVTPEGDATGDNVENAGD